MALNVKALPQTLRAAALFFVLPGAAFGLFVLWAGASIFLWGLNRHARTQAAVMRDVFSGTRVRPAAQHSPRRPASVLNCMRLCPSGSRPARAQRLEASY